MIEGAPQLPAGFARTYLPPSVIFAPYASEHRIVRTRMAPRTDDALLEAARHGDLDARGELLERYRQTMFQLACKTVGPHREPDAHDCVQDAFLKASNKLDSFAGDAKFSTWLYRITYNTCLDWLRKHAAHDRNLPIDDPDVPETAWLPPPSLVDDIVTTGTRRRELGAIFTKALGQLHDREKTVLLLQTYEDLSTTEIATRLAWPVGTVKTRLRSAKINMRKFLVHHGLTADA